MSNRSSWILAMWVGLCLAASLMLLNTVGGAEHTPAEETALPLLSEILTIPLPLREMADLRRAVLPVGLAGLIVISMFVRPEAALPRWYSPLAVTLVGIVCFSALINRTVELSAGWIVQLICGIAWAGMLARFVTPELVRRVLAVSAVVVVLAAAVTFWHRHKFGYVYVRWPIGPITLCAELGAIWLVAAAGFVVGSYGGTRSASAPRKFRGGIVVALVAALAGLALVIVSGRRGAYIGVLAGGSLVAGLAAAARLSARAGKRLAVAGVACVVLATVVYTLIEFRGASRESSGSLTIRTFYWRCMAQGIFENPLLGVGPDQFVCDGAVRLARDRAEMPHVLHGSVEPAGHNEWLQVVYELGLPGGALYGAIPMVVLIAGIRRWRAGGAAESGGCLLALIAALAALAVTEGVSINLRYQIMPLWYWTLIGLTLGLSRTAGGAGGEKATTPWPVMPTRMFAMAAVIALAILDVSASYHLVQGRALLDQDPVAARDKYARILGPFGAARRLETKFEQATAWENVFRGRLPTGFAAGSDALPERARSEHADVVLAAWERLYLANRSYPGVSTHLAMALILDRQLTRAKEVLAYYLEHLDPYDATANLIAARGFAGSAAERLDCAVRSLRAAAINGDVVELARDQLGNAEASGAWLQRLGGAERSLSVDENQWTEPLAPEIARVEAALLDARGDRAGAAMWQVRAAECYKRLYDANDPHRRASAAETDAWRLAAELTFKADPARYQEAARCADEAERFAVLGMAHEYLREPDPSAGFVGGVVVPVEAPAWARVVWQTSAKMRLAAGRMTMLDRRIRSALSPNRQSDDDVGAAVRFLSRELVTAFDTIPAEKRPPHYFQLRAWAGLGTATAPASSTVTTSTEP